MNIVTEWKMTLTFVRPVQNTERIDKYISRMFDEIWKSVTGDVVWKAVWQRTPKQTDILEEERQEQPLNTVSNKIGSSHLDAERRTARRISNVNGFINLHSHYHSQRPAQISEKQQGVRNDHMAGAVEKWRKVQRVGSPDWQAELAQLFDPNIVITAVHDPRDRWVMIAVSPGLQSTFDFV
ncbi:hypothetical protein BDQ12DRAFT_771542 [Crucibulum laeve]|uniref:Uncharacterized protein n=1 Tax=Crucibulum laeve TaxID=68775 RepID=A0A5C3LIW9_9AGAR|nr:hypothetical protein BDQ12DRAFT_771542 [Crucibulum laeve]